MFPSELFFSFSFSQQKSFLCVIDMAVLELAHVDQAVLKLIEILLLMPPKHYPAEVVLF